MWKPTERIKFITRVGHWPDAQKAANSLLFSPLVAGRLRLRQRTWVPAMVPWRSNEAGDVTDQVLGWYERFAHGRPGVIVVEATGIRDIPSGPLLRIGHDGCIEGLKALVDCVRVASGGETRLFIQLIDFLTVRRRPEPTKYLSQFLPITAAHRSYFSLPAASDDEIKALLLGLTETELAEVLSEREYEAMTYGYRERITDTDFDTIVALPEQLPQLFAAATRRAAEAGFDGVELHYAHAYTMASFLSRTNNRTDGYGGSPKARLRLALEVLAAARAASPDDFIIGCRMLTDEIIAGGSRLSDATYYAVQLAAAGMDYLSFSRGGKFDDAKQPKIGESVYPYTGPSGYECMPGYLSDSFGPFGRNIDPVAAIKVALGESGLATPCVLSGGMHGYDQAESLLQSGWADIIGFARQALADPDWFTKVRSGHGSEVNLCEYTNYCEGLDQKHKQVTCKLWDRQALDAPDVVKSNDGKRRLTAPHWSAPAS